MAAKAPAEDVLCEALDYLSKLGCNLRLRSESIKTKKVRRDKPNVLALHKAANKVLLICELSKKSILNVETGVRKVIDELDKAQSSSNGRRSMHEDAEKEVRYFYFQYKSRKIRMRKEISLKHYTSAKVVVRSIPKAMIDKYPVYYDCKLYRLRKEQPVMSLQDLTDKSEYQKKDDIEQFAIVDRLHDVNEKEKDGSFVPDSPKSVRKIIENENITSEPIISTSNLSKMLVSDNLKSLEKVSGEDTMNSGGKILMGRRNSESSSVSETTSRQRNLSVSRNDSIEVTKSGINSDKDNRETDTAFKLRFCSGDKTENASKALNGKGKIVSRDISASVSGKSQKIISKDVSMSLDKKGRKSVSEKENADSEPDTYKRSFKKFKKVNVIKDSSDEEDQLESDKNTIENNAKTDITTDHTEDKESKQEPILKKMKLSSAATHSNVGIIMDPDPSEIIDKDNTEKEQCKDNVKKPFIKCVSLTKLLRPNILNKGPGSKNDSAIIPKCKKNEPRNKNSNKLSQKNDTEQDYWTQKRKEVALFKSKRFTIKIAKLPKISESYLQKLSLKKITCNGKIICEILSHSKNIIDESLSEPLSGGNGEHKSGGSRETIDDSGSDGELIAVVNKIRDSVLTGTDTENFHLQYSDSEGDIDRNCKDKSNEMVKKSLLNDSEDSSEATKTKTYKCGQNLDNTKEKTNNDKDLTITRNKLEQENEASQSHKVGDEIFNEEQNKNLEDILKKPLPIGQDNEKTPEKVMQDSSNEEEIKTPLSQRKKSNNLKRRIRESMHAKKMLLTYSSSSDTEDEKLKNVLKEIKHSLLNGSDDENMSKKDKPKSNESGSSSEDNDSRHTNNTLNESEDDKTSKHRRKKYHKRLESEHDSDDPKSRKKVRSMKS